jgi:hypothetical protein
MPGFSKLRSFLATTTAAALLTTATAPVLVSPAQAMTVLQVDLDTLVAASALVLYGDVVATTVVDRRKEGRSVWTEVSVQVREVWKGDKKLAGQRFSWRTLGGTTADGLTLAVPGMPQFRAGEQIVVALEKTAEGYVVTGGPQGKFAVSKEQSGQLLVRRPVTDVHAVRRDDKTGKLVEAKIVPVVRTLPQFRADIAAIVTPAAKSAK